MDAPPPRPAAAPAAEPAGSPGGNASLAASVLAALGVVYGDIGTSPLYALRECFAGTHPVSVNTANVLGVLSLALWSLLLVVTAKYLLVVMRADNHGEGGILALLALVLRAGSTPDKQPRRPNKVAWF